MKKVLIFVLGLVILLPFTSSSASAGYYDEFYTYTVQTNDTLSSISVKYRVGQDEIINVNTALQTNPNVYVGQVLKIPNLSKIKAFQEEVVRLTNLERAKYNLAPLKSDWEISRVARYKANDMRDNNYFSHYSPTYGDAFLMMRDFGISYTTAGENIAARQTTPDQVVTSWMNSETHKENILNPSFGKIGVGYSNGGILTHYWVQMFTN